MTPYETFTAQEKEQQALMDAYYRETWGEESDRSEACYQYDLRLSWFGRVEEKFRFASYPDILVEVIQDLRTRQMGWFYLCDADWLFYVTVQSGMPALLWRARLREFKEWCLDYFESHQRLLGIISTRGRGMPLNIAIPKKDIPAELAMEADLREFFLERV